MFVRSQRSRSDRTDGLLNESIDRFSDWRMRKLEGTERWIRYVVCQVFKLTMSGGIP